MKADDEEEPDGDSEKDNSPVLRSTKKRSLSTAEDKPHVQRHIKHGRFSSPLSSDEETETGGESEISSYTPWVPYRASNTRPVSSRSTGLEEDISDDGKTEFTRGRSQTTVIYEQQSWQGEIIREKNVKQGAEGSQAIPDKLETVLGGRRPAHRAGVGSELKGKEGIKTQVLKLRMVRRR